MINTISKICTLLGALKGGLCRGVTSIERDNCEGACSQQGYIISFCESGHARQRGQLTFGLLNKRNLTKLNAINYDTQWY